MQNLRELLIAGGATGLTGWTLTQASGISADGRTIVGFGRNPRGQTEAWIAHLDLGPTLAGDFNEDGVVDAADYVVWRKGLGTTYTQKDYDTWRAHFGQTAGIGSDQAPSRGLRGSAVGRHAGAGNLYDAGDGDGHGLFSPSRGSRNLRQRRRALNSL